MEFQARETNPNHPSPLLNIDHKCDQEREQELHLISVYAFEAAQITEEI